MSDGSYTERLKVALSEVNPVQVAEAVARLKGVRVMEGRAFVLGNGGSYANAGHLILHLQELGIMAENLLGNPETTSALANDTSYASLAAIRLRKAYTGQEGVLIVLSGSGNSENVILALAEAKRLGMHSIALLGMGGGMALKLTTFPITIACREYGPIEDVHSAIVHMIAEGLGDKSTSHGPPLAFS